jgi:hypothetical protein
MSKQSTHPSPGQQTCPPCCCSTCRPTPASSSLFRDRRPVRPPRHRHSDRTGAAAAAWPAVPHLNGVPCGVPLAPGQSWAVDLTAQPKAKPTLTRCSAHSARPIRHMATTAPALHTLSLNVQQRVPEHETAGFVLLQPLVYSPKRGQQSSDARPPLIT